jgi:hypothetical protein
MATAMAERRQNFGTIFACGDIGEARVPRRVAHSVALARQVICGIDATGPHRLAGTP